MSDNYYKCADCGIDVNEAKEYAFMVKPFTWRTSLRKAGKAGLSPSTYDVVCVECLEKRLGRKLKRRDFDWNNYINIGKYARSSRLRARMRNEEPEQQEEPAPAEEES